MNGIDLNGDAWIVLAIVAVLVLAFLASRRRSS
jgi:MYXO-CTERM domain-containing protein